MNFPRKENPQQRQALLGCLFVFALFALYFLVPFLASPGSLQELIARANSTRTAIALTSDALLGPFPTATRPTSTPSNTPSITPTASITPSPQPTRTPIRYFINTPTPRTPVQDDELTSVVLPTSPPRQPTNPPPQATDPPRQPTNPPPRPTNPPRKASKTPKPPKSTKTPKKYPPPASCTDPQGCLYFTPAPIHGTSAGRSMKGMTVENGTT